MTTTIPTERAALILQMDAGYTPTTTDPARACASCRWYSELPGTSQCHLVVNSPEPINAGGGCNRHEPMPEGSAVITYMDDFSMENPNNARMPVSPKTRVPTSIAEYAIASRIMSLSEADPLSEGDTKVVARASSNKYGIKNLEAAFQSAVGTVCAANSSSASNDML